MSEAEIDGIKKSAILLLALGMETASSVLQYMNDQEIQQISQYISQMREVDAHEVNLVLREFQTRSKALDNTVIGGERYVHKLLQKTLTPERANSILNTIAVPDIETGLKALNSVDTQTIARFLQSEHPQTTAVVIAHLEPQQAGAVIAAFPDSQQMDILMRIAKLEHIPAGVIQDLNRVLQTELKASDDLVTNQVGGAKVVADILNSINQETERKIMSTIEETDAPLAEEIRYLMFTFEDFQHLDDRGMQTLLRETSNDELTLALKMASETLREKILRNMSQRAAEMLRDELETMGPVRVSDVEQAQQSIAQTAKRLEEEGRLVLGGRGDNNFV